MYEVVKCKQKTTGQIRAFLFGMALMGGLCAGLWITRTPVQETWEIKPITMGELNGRAPMPRKPTMGK